MSGTTNKLAIQATLDASGVQRGAQQAEQAIEGITRSAQRTASAATISGEKMARYATSAGMLSGTFQKLGIQNDLVARGFSVVGDAAMGTMGILGGVTLAVGVLGAAIGAIIAKHKEEKQAIEDANKALYARIEANRILAAQTPGDPLAARSLGMTGAALQADIARIEARRAELEALFAAGGTMERTGFVDAEGNPYLFLKEFNEGQLAKMRKEASDLAEELLKARGAYRQLIGGDAGPMPEDPMTVYARQWAEEQRRQREAAQGRLEGMIPGVRAGMGRLGPVDFRQEARGAIGPMSVRDTLGAKPFSAEELFGMGGFDAVRENAKKAIEGIAEDMRKARIAESLGDGIYGAIVAGKRGVDELGSYVLDFFGNNVLRALSEMFATSIASALPGGGLVSALFTGSFGGKDLAAAKAMNSQRRAVRG